MMKKLLLKLRLVKMIVLVGICLSFSLSSIFGQSRQVLLESYWWNWSNSTYPNQYGDYMTEFAPRLRTMGIDAIWVMPSIKNSGSMWMGYGPFDGYDLGDKYQKGHVKTIFGNKNELLRMVGVLHSNNINVIQDIVYNHFMWPGSLDRDDGGNGGADPAAWGDWKKNFRYTSFTCPAGNESAADYLARSGRFPKNWQNFHNNPAHDCNSGNICVDWFGPDVCYWDGAYGLSSNATYNPAQYSQYMRIQQRNWGIWYKKQEGFDGVRLDAVKHFEAWAAEDFLYHMQYSAGWANGGANMYAVGEWLPESCCDQDQWCNDVQNRAGTFDFNLRDGLYGIVSGSGYYNLGEIPGKQQGNRQRTVPFVNNHDTYRPNLDANGYITGWDTGHELRPHIESGDCRISVCYAIIMAVDGSPQVFLEDLFNLTNGKRFTHKPSSTTDLPIRSDIANLIQCRNKLNFMGGAYNVRLGNPDHLIIERYGKAVISVNDSWDQWKEDWVTTGFPQGTVLKDYSGANTHTLTVPADGRVAIKTPPCNGTALNGRRGYAVWAPTGQTLNYVPTRGTTTTQEWEMADDIGDSHVNSLQEGGRLPASSTAWRTIGRIYVAANTNIKFDLRTEQSTKNTTINLVQGATTKSSSGNGNYVYNCSFTTAGWVTLKVRYTSATTPAQKVWAIITYTSPTVINTITADTDPKYKLANATSMELYQEMLALRVYDQNLKDIEEGSDLKVFPNPTNHENINLMVTSKEKREVTIKVINIQGKLVYEQKMRLEAGSSNVKLEAKLSSGLYLVSIPELNAKSKLLINK